MAWNTGTGWQPSGQTSGQTAWGTPSETQPPAYPPPQPERPTSSAQGFLIGSAVCAVVALFLLPIIFGPAGAVLGFIAYSKGDRRGLWLGIASIVATLLGFAIGFAVMRAIRT
ncbi:MAG: hypothetical protein ACRDJ4_02285 [Actinomycetota bacterium]